MQEIGKPDSFIYLLNLEYFEVRWSQSALQLTMQSVFKSTDSLRKSLMSSTRSPALLTFGPCHVQYELYTWAVTGAGNTKSCRGVCGPTYGGKKANLSLGIFVRL